MSRMITELRKVRRDYNNLCFNAEEFYLGGRNAWEDYSVQHDVLQGRFRDIYEGAKSLFPNHPLVRQLEKEDIEETLSLGAGSFDSE